MLLGTDRDLRSTLIRAAGEAKPRDPNAVALAAVPMFAQVEEEALLQLASSCRRRRIDAAEVSLFHEGDEPGSLYVILQGEIHIRTATAAGKIVHIAERGPGDHIGELSLIDGAPRMADAVTASPCELLVLRREAFLQCVEQNSKIALAVMTALAERLREAARHLAAQEEMDVPGRVARLLLEMMTDHGSPLAKGEVKLTLRRTQQQMADQIGAARETVTRALADLKRLSIIRSEGRDIIVCDPKKLKQQAERI